MRSKVPVASRESYRLGALALFGATAVILAALAFEYLGGYAPCPLCLTERYAYYAGIPLLFASLVAVTSNAERAASVGFVVAGLLFLANAGLGFYHAGVEWGFWAGPATCSGGLTPLGSPADLLNGKVATVIRCDKAEWHLFGLSFAGWNAIISACLWITTWQAARAVQTDKLTRVL